MKKNKLLIAGYDFEQQIQRGITFYSKGLCESLNRENIYVDILTSARSAKENVVTLQNIVQQLTNPMVNSKWKRLVRYYLFKVRNSGANVSLTGYDLIDHRIEYLRYIESFFNIPGFYDTVTINNGINKLQPLYLKLDNNKYTSLFTTSPLSVRTNIPMIQTVHDLFPLLSSLHPPDDYAHRFYNRLKSSMLYSNVVIAVSEYTKKEILKVFPKYEDKIKVIYQQAPFFCYEEKMINDSDVQLSVLKRFKLRKNNYLFYVGMLEKRKNIKGMIEAYLGVSGKVKIPLVLSGALGYGSEEFSKYLKKGAKDKKIKYLGYISNIEKLILMKNARAFLFPSFAEGFGIPILEALTLGTPVLTSNRTAMPEVGGEAALYVNPVDISDIARGIVRISTDETTRLEIESYIPKQLKKFSPEVYSKSLLEVIGDY